MAFEADMPDLFQRHFKRFRTAGGGDVGGRDQPADVAKSPGAERRLARGGQRHQPVRRRWKVVHQGSGHTSSSILSAGALRGPGQTPITFRRAVNWNADIADQSTAATPFSGGKRRVRWNKKALLPRCHSYERSLLRHCPEATKLRPRCLIDVDSDSDITGIHS